MIRALGVRQAREDIVSLRQEIAVRLIAAIATLEPNDEGYCFFKS